MFETNFHIKSRNVSTIDYKRPVPPRNDMRTSYYVGHRLIYDNDVRSKDTVGDTSIVLRKKPYQPEMKSEMKAAFTPKYPEPTARYTSQCIQKLQGIKAFEEGMLKFAPRPIDIHITTYKKDYVKKKSAPELVPQLDDLGIESQVKPATYTVSPEKPDYAKYLDMMASSYTLNYAPYSKEQLSTLASRDGVTFWTWNDTVKSNVVKEVHPTYISTFAKSKDVIPSRNSIKTRSVPKLTKCVPHSGLTTEFKCKYIYPDDSLKWKVDIQQPMHMVEQIRFVHPKTEYSMIGSGDRIQRYV